MVKYKTVITFIGENFEEMMRNNLIILFDDSAPEELKAFCAIHNGSEIKGKVKVGDKLLIDNQVYTITAVGDVANKNLKNLGHVVLKFDGNARPELPGYLHLTPSLTSRITIGTELQIID